MREVTHSTEYQWGKSIGYVLSATLFGVILDLILFYGRGVARPDIVLIIVVIVIVLGTALKRWLG